MHHRMTTLFNGPCITKYTEKKTDINLRSCEKPLKDNTNLNTQNNIQWKGIDKRKKTMNLFAPA